MVFTVSGWITLRNPNFSNSFAEGFSSTISVALVAFSVIFPLCICSILYYNLIRKKQPLVLMKRFASIINGVYGFEENHFEMAITTVMFPMARGLICAIAVTQMNNRQTTFFFFM